MTMSHRLPERGMWYVSRRQGAGEMPFDLIKLDLRGRGAGTVRSRNLETQLRRVRVTGPDRFVAVYDVRGHRGEIAGVCRPDGSLRLSLTGTVTATVVACADNAAADGQMTAWGLADGDTAETPAALRALAGAVDALCRPAEMGRAAAA
jgi:hypothetical protein